MGAEPAIESSASSSLEVPTPSEPVEVVKQEVVEPQKARTGGDDAVEAAERNDEDARKTIPVPNVQETVLSFKEESYYVKDLKDLEKKALEALKGKIEEAIRGNIFLEPPKPKKAPVVTEKKAEEIPKEGSATEFPPEEVESPKVEDAQNTAKTEPVELASAKISNDQASAPSVVEPEPLDSKEEMPPEAAPREISVGKKEEVPAEIVPPEERKEEASVEEDITCSLEDLSLWGIPLLPSKGDERTNVVLLKFLRARDFKVKEAMSMLQDTMAWRKEFKVDSLEEEAVASEFESMAYVHGVDKKGHPVCYNRELFTKSLDDEEQVNKFIRWRVRMLEKDIQKLDFNVDGLHTFLQVVDMKHLPGLGYRKSLTKKVLSLLQDNYPELVAKQIFVNVPWYFGAIYMLHGKMITPRLKSKVVLARPGKVTETLFKYISPENVPVEYGGLSRLNDTEFSGVDAPMREVIVKAGEKKVVDLEVDEAGSAIVWDLSCPGWELVYGEEFVPRDEAQYTMIVQKAKKMGAAEEPVRNSFKATEPGKVVITLDNTTSKRKKLAFYRYTIKKA